MTLAAIEDSRNKGGTLSLGGVAFGKQATDVSLVPAVVAGEGAVEVLTGQKISADETYDWALNLGFIQDFNEPAGLVMHLRDNAGEVQTYSWTPNQDGADTFTGTCRIRPTTIGGAVATRLTGTVELPVVTQT